MKAVICPFKSHDLMIKHVLLGITKIDNEKTTSQSTKKLWS
jgi:hypothetical protein